MDLSWYQYVIAIVGGAFAGMLNTLAGNGSAVTLTILTEVLLLPGNLANGTNRVGVLIQSIASTSAFYRNGKLNLKAGWFYIIPVVIGAVGGILLANWVSNEQFRQVYRFLMLAMLLLVLTRPSRWLSKGQEAEGQKHWYLVPVFVLLGVYGGFIQMGMGVFFLAAMVLGAQYNIIMANGIKLFVIGLYTLGALFVFWWNGLVDWRIGALLAVGQASGGWLTAHYATKYEGTEIWAYRVLVVVIILAVGKLFYPTIIGWF